MSLRWYYRDNDGGISEIVGQVQFVGSPDRPGTDGLVANAEEDTVGASQFIVDDPTGAFEISGHRLIYAVETAASGDDYGGRIGVGYSVIREVVEDSPFDGVGRRWTINVDDLNTLIDRRIMRGSDANRPAETDVERMQWLASTSEFSLVDDTTTYLSTADPVDMDAADYRDQKIAQIIDDCRQQSGKNSYLLWLNDGAGGINITLWYGAGTLATFVSDAVISNVQADIAGGAYIPAAKSKLRTDPTRVYSGVVGQPKGIPSVYRTRPATATAFALGGRDTTSPMPNITTATKANARADRYLESVKTEEHVITTSIVVTAANVNIAVQGQLISVRFSWMPYGYDTATLGRILNRTARPLALGLYELAMEIAMTPVANPAAACAVVGATLAAGAGDSGVVTGDTSAWASVPSPSAYPAVVLVGGFYVNGGTDIGGPPVSVDSPYTLSDSYSSAGYDHSICDVAYQALASGAPGSFFTHWSGGGGASAWEALSIALPTAETAPVQTAPVQSGGVSTFPSALTVGNIVLMCQVNETSGVPAIPTGWTLIKDANFSAPFTVGTQGIAWFYHCVTEASTTIGTGNPSFTHFSFLTEWALT